MYKQSLLLLLSLQRDVTTDSAWMADWCLAFQSVLVGSSWYKRGHLLGVLLAPRARRLTRKINCLANNKGLVNVNQNEGGGAACRYEAEVSDKNWPEGSFPFWSVSQALGIHGLNHTASSIACLGWVSILSRSSHACQNLDRCKIFPRSHHQCFNTVWSFEDTWFFSLLSLYDILQQRVPQINWELSYKKPIINLKCIALILLIPLLPCICRKDELACFPIYLYCISP